MTVSKITRVPLREVWAHEALDFTTWLERNVDVLNEVLDFNLVSAEREKAAGDFSVDLVGEDEDGNTVVVENQLEPSDHRHLGQVLTYLAMMDAKAAVWIVARARAEHVSAIAWLNESTSTPFYLLQVEAVRIGDSAAAPLFTRIVGPSVEARAAGQAKQHVSEREAERRRFWTILLEHSNRRTDLHAGVTPGEKPWIHTGAGISGLGFNYYLKKHDIRIELYFNAGAEKNLAVFDALSALKPQIEDGYGHPLHWQRLEGKRACRISHTLEVGGLLDTGRWDEIAETAVGAMIRFESAIREPLERVRAEVGSR